MVFIGGPKNRPPVPSMNFNLNKQHDADGRQVGLQASMVAVGPPSPSLAWSAQDPRCLPRRPQARWSSWRITTLLQLAGNTPLGLGWSRRLRRAALEFSEPDVLASSVLSFTGDWDVTTCDTDFRSRLFNGSYEHIGYTHASLWQVKYKTYFPQ